MVNNGYHWFNSWLIWFPMADIVLIVGYPTNQECIQSWLVENGYQWLVINGYQWLIKVDMVTGGESSMVYWT